jgi:excisionase family DNA binding protein
LKAHLSGGFLFSHPEKFAPKIHAPFHLPNCPRQSKQVLLRGFKMATGGTEFLTPPQFAKRLGVSEEKILTWIHSGELIAVNAAVDADGDRPRWRIALEEITRFLNARANKPPEPKPPKRRRRRAVSVGEEWF